jgi:hypothetical protein
METAAESQASETAAAAAKASEEAR